MNRPSIVTLTWGTCIAAVLCAVVMAGGESGLPDNPLFAYPARTLARHDALPSEPTAAGPHGRFGPHGAGASSNPPRPGPAPH